MIPAWDLKTLYSANDEGGNSLTPISPITGKRAGPNIPVSDPYNMYFTPDGKFAIVVAGSREAARLLRPAHLRARARAGRAGVRRGEPHRLLRRRLVLHRHL